MKINPNQSGQVVVALLLTILVGLSIGLVVTQRSITDVTTSTQTEQSSRAFSAAEAGIERALSNETALLSTSETGNDSTATIKANKDLPKPGQALECSPVSKDKTSQFWLVNPDINDGTFGSGGYPANSRLHLYFGNRNDTPAIETYFVYDTGPNTSYQSSTKVFFDTVSRSTENGITNVCDSSTDQTKWPVPENHPITTTYSKDVNDYRPFKCRVELKTPSTVNARPIMLRVRLLYSDVPQIIALAPDTAAGLSLTPQEDIFYSTGKAGQSQRSISLIQCKKNLSNLLDYAVFSDSPLVK